MRAIVILNRSHPRSQRAFSCGSNLRNHWIRQNGWKCYGRTRGKKLRRSRRVERKSFCLTFQRVWIIFPDKSHGVVPRKSFMLIYGMKCVTLRAIIKVCVRLIICWKVRITLLLYFLYFIAKRSKISAWWAWAYYWLWWDVCASFRETFCRK